MLKIAYRNENGYRGIDINTPEKLLPYIVKGAIDSMQNCSVIDLYIDYDLPKNEDCEDVDKEKCN